MEYNITSRQRRLEHVALTEKDRSSERSEKTMDTATVEAPATISTHDAADMIRQSNGKIFSVKFIKRSTGSLRRMVGRTGVKQGVTGEGKAFNAADHDLLTVFELVTDEQRGEKGQLRNAGKQFRHVSIEGIRELKIGGKIYLVG